MKKDKLFSDSYFNKQLVRLALPIVVQSFMLAAVAAADAFMLGSLEQNAMSAVSLASQIQFVQNQILTAVVSVMSILGAQYWGKGDVRAISRIMCIGTRFCMLTSIIFFVGCVGFPRELMTIFTNEEELITIGISYLRIAGFSYLLTGLSQCYLTVMKVTDHPSDSAVISSVAVVLNIALNAVLIFGLLGAPAMGVRGAATATLIARIVELIWCIALSFKKSYVALDVPGLFKRDRILTKDYIKCMLPLVGAILLWSIGFTSYSTFMGHMGTDAAAANSVVSVVRDLLCCLCNGLASGGGILVGNELGAGRLDRGKLYGNRVTKLGFIAGFACTGIMLALIPPILSFVKLTDGARGYVTGMMIVMAFYMIGRTANTVIVNGVFEAGGDTLFDMYSLIVAMWMIAVPLAALGTYYFHWPVVVVYACTCLDEVGKIPWVMIHYRKYKWVKDLTRPMP